MYKCKKCGENKPLTDTTLSKAISYLDKHKQGKTL